MSKRLLPFFVTFVLISCSHPKLLLFYGTEQKYLIYSDSLLANGNITFSTNDCLFKFNGNDFKNEISKDLDESNRTDRDYLVNNFMAGNYKLVFIKKDNHIILNDSIEFKYPYDYLISNTLDKLVVSGHFYVEQKNKYVRFIEHIHWQPQYQGTINTKWIVNDKTVYEIIFGFAD